MVPSLLLLDDHDQEVSSDEGLLLLLLLLVLRRVGVSRIIARIEEEEAVVVVDDDDEQNSVNKVLMVSFVLPVLLPVVLLLPDINSFCCDKVIHLFATTAVEAVEGDVAVVEVAAAAMVNQLLVMCSNKIMSTAIRCIIRQHTLPHEQKLEGKTNKNKVSTFFFLLGV